jgi:hypothetical protein
MIGKVKGGEPIEVGAEGGQFFIVGCGCHGQFGCCGAADRCMHEIPSVCWLLVKAKATKGEV